MASYRYLWNIARGGLIRFCRKFNNNYPKIEYLGTDFLKDTNRILAELETGALI